MGLTARLFAAAIQRNAGVLGAVEIINFPLPDGAGSHMLCLTLAKGQAHIPSPSACEWAAAYFSRALPLTCRQPALHTLVNAHAAGSGTAGTAEPYP